MGASNAWQEKDGLPNQIHSLASENKPYLIYSIFLYILYLKLFEIKNENCSHSSFQTWSSQE